MSSQANAVNLSNSSSEYLGPYLPRGMNRVVFDYDDKQAPAPGYIPPLLLKERVRYCPEVTQELLTRLQDDLKNHFEYRIQVLFQQMLLVYKTGVVFENYAKADCQIGEGASEGDRHYVAAHSSTLPTLRVGSPGGPSISFGWGTFFYRTWNATIYLPEVVNQADSAIDRSTMTDEKESIRDFTTALLNSVSQGKKTPGEGLSDFVKTALRPVRYLYEHAENEERRLIFNTYLEIGEFYRDKLETGFLIQKLCFADEKTRATEEFYLKVQAPMRKLLKDELKAPSFLPSEIPANEIDWTHLRNKLWAKVEAQALHLKDTGAQYKQLCFHIPEIQAIAFALLQFLFLGDTSKKIGGLISQQLAEGSTLYEQMRKEIQDKYKVASPQNLPAIAMHLLTAFCDEFLRKKESLAAPEEKKGDSPERKEDLPAAPKASPAKPFVVRTEIENTIKKEKFGLVGKAKEYQALCALSKTVQTTALECLELLKESSSLCKEQLRQIVHIKTSKTVERRNLSDVVSRLYQAVLSKIRAKCNVKEPMQMPSILLHLLLHFETRPNL